jgi:syntaxin 5
VLEELVVMFGRREERYANKPTPQSELSFVIKQSLARINQDLTSLKSLSKTHTQKSGDQLGRHEEGVVVLLQQRLGDTTTSFRSVLELRSKNLAASRERTSAFTSQVSNPSSLPVSRTDSPLYAPGASGKGPYQMTQAARSDILSLDMPSEGSGSALARAGGASAQQLMMLEEGAQSNEYVLA